MKKMLFVKCTNCGIEFQKCNSYIKQGQNRGYTNHFCSNKCSCEYNRKLRIDVLLPKRKEEYYKNPKKCLYCYSIIPYEKRNDNVNYCSLKCASTHTQKDGGHCKWSEKDKQILSSQVKHLWKIGVYDTIKKDKTEKICPNCNKKFLVSSYQLNKICCSRKCFYEWSVKSRLYKGKRGGLRPNSGTSKKGWYKGYFCGSSWELAWVMYNLDFGIKFERNKIGFCYVFENQPRKYYPDFISNDEYIEIKGYHSKQFDEKVAQFPHKLKVLHKKDLENVLEYVISKYGKDFTKLYEKY